MVGSVMAQDVLAAWWCGIRNIDIWSINTTRMYGV